MGLLGRVEIRGVVLFLIFRYPKFYWILNVFSYVCNRNQLLLTQIICRYYVLKKDNSTVFLLLYAKRCKGAVWSNPYKLSSTERASREGSLRGVRSFYIYRCNRGVQVQIFYLAGQVSIAVLCTGCLP